MNKKHWAAGIVHHNNEYIILEKVYNHYHLPKIRISLGLDAIKELKAEIEKEYVLKVQFQRSLQLSWSELLQLHSGTVSEFTNYYVFNCGQYSERDHFWIPVIDLDNIELEEHDRDALDYFLAN